MRVLFTFAGGSGHFLPLVPIARAARAAGHDVAFAGQAGMVDVVEASGFTAFDSGGGTLRASGARTDLLALDTGREALVVRETYARRVARERAAALSAVADEWFPDLFVCDELDFGAMIAAERRGLPHATVECIAGGAFVTGALIAEPLAELRIEHGLEPDLGLAMPGRYLVLSPFPPSFRGHGARPGPTTHLISPLASGGSDGEAPSWIDALPDAPIVYVTLGTIFNLESGDLFERVLEGVRALPVGVVVTVGRELDPRDLGPQPANVRVERFVPQAALLPSCTLVVSHGGSGSVVGALSHGLPMVILPIGADQPQNAERCERLGVGRVLDPVEAEPDEIREAVSTVLADPGYRRSAERLADEIAALPGPEHAVALLERLTVDRRPLAT